MTAEALREEQETLDSGIDGQDTAPEALPEDTTDNPTEGGEQYTDNEAEDGNQGCEDVDADSGEDNTDYAAIAAGDLKELKGEFPELAGLEHISGLDNPLRYAALRDLGLTPREAYLATAKRQRPDGRAHLSSAMPKGAGSPTGGMTSRQLADAREIFSDMSDAEIRSLYKKVTR